MRKNQGALEKGDSYRSRHAFLAIFVGRAHAAKWKTLEHVMGLRYTQLSQLVSLVVA